MFQSGNTTEKWLKHSKMLVGKVRELWSKWWRGGEAAGGGGVPRSG